MFLVNNPSTATIEVILLTNNLLTLLYLKFMNLNLILIPNLGFIGAS